MFALWGRTSKSELPHVWQLHRNDVPEQLHGRHGVGGIPVCSPCVLPSTSRRRSHGHLHTFSSAQHARGAFFVVYAIEFMCLSAANLMVLDRMADFAFRAASEAVSEGLVRGKRLVMAVVVAANVAGLCGNVVAAVYFKESADLYSAAAIEYASNNSVAARSIRLQGRQKNENASSVASVQQFCEVAVLVIVIIAVCSH
jgi:hypothetical protein